MEAVRRFSSTFSRRRIKYFPTNGVGFGKKTLIGLLFNLEVWEEEDYNIEKVIYGDGLVDMIHAHSI